MSYEILFKYKWFDGSLLGQTKGPIPSPVQMYYVMTIKR